MEFHEKKVRFIRFVRSIIYSKQKRDGKQKDILLECSCRAIKPSKSILNKKRSVAQQVRAAGLYPACRGFESFRSDLRGRAVWELAGPITRRSQVQILPSLVWLTLCYILRSRMEREQMNLNMSECGVSAKELSEAVQKLMSLMPPPGEEDIELIKKNPCLSWWQKRKLMRKIKNM